MSMGKFIGSLSSKNDTVGEKALALNKGKGESISTVDKKNTTGKGNVKRSDCKSSARIHIHGDKKVKHHQKESITKEYNINICHKKSSNSQTSEKYATNNSAKNEYIESSLYQRKETSYKNITYDPQLDITEGYNPKYPDIYHSSKSIKKERDACDLLLSSKSVKRECSMYEPSAKRKLEVQTETMGEFKPKKLKSISKSDKVSEKKNKNKMHVKESISQSEEMQSLKKKVRESINNYFKDKSSDKCDSSKRKKSDKNEKKSSKKAKLKINSTEEFTSSEANFEDCLGLNDIVIKKRKSSKPIQNVTKTEKKAQKKVPTVNYEHSSSHSLHPSTHKTSSVSLKEKLPLRVPKPEKIVKIEDVVVASSFPQTLPNYRPLPRVESNPMKKEVLSNEDAILFMSSKREKTAVYSGRRSLYYTEVPSLFESCIRVLIDNIDCIEYTGCIPYYVLKPMLEKCSPQQLLHIEDYNPYLLEDTDELWEIHCKRDCKLLKLEENETYRELYLRAKDEREKKLRNLTANISASMSKYYPARQVKLAYVDSVAKPPRDVARKQAKNGTAISANSPVKAVPPPKATPSNAASVVKPGSSSPPVRNHVVKTKPKVAPLMAKTLKSMKQCFRR